GKNTTAWPHVSSDDTNFFVSWLMSPTKGSSSDDDVFGTGVTALDVIATNLGIAIGTSPEWAQSPAITHDGRHYWASWAEDTPPATSGRIAATRLDSAGALLDGPARTGAFT